GRRDRGVIGVAGVSDREAFTIRRRDGGGHLNFPISASVRNRSDRQPNSDWPISIAVKRNRAGRFQGDVRCRHSSIDHAGCRHCASVVQSRWAGADVRGRAVKHVQRKRTAHGRGVFRITTVLRGQHMRARGWYCYVREIGIEAEPWRRTVLPREPGHGKGAAQLGCPIEESNRTCGSRTRLRLRASTHENLKWHAFYRIADQWLFCGRSRRRRDRDRISARTCAVAVVTAVACGEDVGAAGKLDALILSVALTVE